MSPPTLERALAKRTAETNRQSKQLMDDTELTVRADIIGMGEATFDVEFPVVFAEKPVFVYGFQLADNHTPTAGAYPSCTATIVRYKLTERSDQRTYYTGCTVVVYTTGVVDLNSTVDMLFKGLAFQDPTIQAITTDEAI